MGKLKYNEEMKLQTVKYVLEGGKSATKVSTIEDVKMDLYR